MEIEARARSSADILKPGTEKAPLTGLVSGAFSVWFWIGLELVPEVLIVDFVVELDFSGLDDSAQLAGAAVG